MHRATLCLNRRSLYFKNVQSTRQQQQKLLAASKTRKITERSRRSIVGLQLRLFNKVIRHDYGEFTGTVIELSDSGKIVESSQVRLFYSVIQGRL